MVHDARSDSEKQFQELAESTQTLQNTDHGVLVWILSGTAYVGSGAVGGGESGVRDGGPPGNGGGALWGKHRVSGLTSAKRLIDKLYWYLVLLV